MKVVEAVSSAVFISICFHDSTTIAVSYIFSLILTFLPTSKQIILVELTVWNLFTDVKYKSRSNNSLLLKTKLTVFIKPNVIYFSVITDSQDSMCVKWIIVDYWGTLMLQNWKVKVVNLWKSSFPVVDYMTIIWMLTICLKITFMWECESQNYSE